MLNVWPLVNVIVKRNVNMKLNEEELEKLYDEVAKRVEGDGWADYYTNICAPVDTEYHDGYISFTAIHSGGREIYTEWRETWYVYDDGSIGNSEGDHWDSIETFDYC